MAENENVDSVKVRMYRHGFGDCFLLSFFCGDQRTFTMLIDCGIKYNTKSDDVPIEAVIKDIRSLLTPDGGDAPQLDVLVATHEHWDHISFFHPERSPDYFSDFKIGQIWLAWTENPEDDEAVEINSRLRDGAAALYFGTRQLLEREPEQIHHARGFYSSDDVASARADFNRVVDDVLGFYGTTAAKEVSESGIKYKPDGKISVLTEQAIEHLVTLGGDETVIQYFSPGETLNENLVPPGLNVHVLGPPRSKLINKSNPSSGNSHETYLSLDRAGMAGFMDGVLRMANPDGVAEDDPGSPFASDVGFGMDVAKDDEFFCKYYFADGDEYRRVDHAWLDNLGQFALQLDGAINNTSLVLAIEFAESGKVMLFPGDAQVGSWLSWHEHEWKPRNDSEDAKRTTEDLLNNTVLYKVSHHGSHNATVADLGLEMMTHPELVAIIPEKEDSYNGILYDPLMKRLNELCKGRVLVSADVNYPPEDITSSRPATLTNIEWEWLKDQLLIDDLFVEVSIKSKIV